MKEASSYPKRNRLSVPYVSVEYQLHQLHWQVTWLSLPDHACSTRNKLGYFYKLNEATAERLSSHPSITLVVNFFFFLQLLTKQFREKLPPSSGTYKM